MNETELAEYARKKKLYVDQIRSWRDACLNANGGMAKEAARLHKELKAAERKKPESDEGAVPEGKSAGGDRRSARLAKKADAIYYNLVK